MKAKLLSNTLFYGLMSLTLLMLPVLTEIVVDLSISSTRMVPSMVIALAWGAAFHWRMSAVTFK